MNHSVRRLSVDSQDNCYVFPDGIAPVEETAATADLRPGIHVIRINNGTFSYFSGGEENQPSVLLWIAGGKYKNKASEVAVGAGWGALNGYNDTYTIEVIETTRLHALFFDTHKDDNVGRIELSILTDALADAPKEPKKKVSGYYELRRNKEDQFYFVLRAGNREIILTGELHTQRESAEQDIISVQENCGIEQCYDTKVSSNDSPYFILTDENNATLGSSQEYSSEAACTRGIASVQRNGITTVVRDKTDVQIAVAY